ncbi:MFS transporter-like protein [Xylariales sp. AK1849]|nr:MFS transporter-like protein [Xylariales sp. AK1849]
MTTSSRFIYRSPHRAMPTEAEPLLNDNISVRQSNEDAIPRRLGIVEDDESISQSGRLNNKDGAQEYLSLRIAAAMFAFLTMGLIQSTVGVMIPRLEDFYSLTDTLVSLIFLGSPVGYFLAAYFNSSIHLYHGQRGIAAIAPACQLIYVAGVSTRPPFPVFLVFSAFGAVGTGLLDGSWCAWAGGMGQRANTVQGFLHGSYSVGASLGPFLAGTMIDIAGRPWWEWFYVLSAFCLVELLVSVFAFRFQDAKRYRAEKHDREGREAGQPRWAVFKHGATWVCAAYFLAYVGIEASITGWIVTYMIRARHTSSYLASICSSLFNIGMAIGRLSLGILTDRLGVRLAVMIYLSTAALLQILFAITEIPAISAVIITIIGFLLGPLFPSGIVMITRLLPSNLHVGAVSFVASIGQVGGALLPFALGAIADRLGIGAFQYIILAQLIVTLFIWMCFPKLVPEAAPISGLVDEDAAHNDN